MKKEFLSIILLNILPVWGGLVGLQAQDTYQSAKMVETDLNGTARYVGMGGAMEALGADLSTMSTNPAGSALFRSSQVAISGGLNFQGNEKNSCSFAGQTIDFNGKTTRASLDQLGFILSFGKEQESYLNFGINFRKSQNFDQILTAAGAFTNANASQSKLTSAKYNYMKTMTEYNQSMITNGVDANYESLMEYNAWSDEYEYLNASDYRFGQYQKGYIGEYDFNLSYNVRNRWYFGFTVGLHDVHYSSNSIYDESNEKDCYTDAYEQVRIKGTGVDFKFGMIVRPMEEGNLRIGAYVHTPTFYSLKYDASSDISIVSPLKKGENGNVSPLKKGENGNDCYYNFRLNTPWRFGVSVGDVFFSKLAVGLTYDYQKLNSLDNRINRDNGSSYSDSDSPMNNWTHECLTGLHTIKIGAEFVATSKLSLRIGYNWLSPMFKKSAYRDGTIVSPGSAYACSTDYTNWYATHRFTCGLGYKLAKHIQWDLAYQFQFRDGEFSPFMSYTGDSNSSNDNIPTGSAVNYARHQFVTTLSYKF